MKEINDQKCVAKADIPCDELLVAKVFEIEAVMPSHREFICARHELGGWLTGWWSAETESMHHHMIAEKEPWERRELTHWISLDRFPSFGD